MLVLTLATRELEGVLLRRWHLVVELWDHRWEAAAHVRWSRVVRAVIWRMELLVHVLLLLLWRRRLAVLPSRLRHVVQLLAWLRLAREAGRGHGSSLVHEVVLLLRTSVGWEDGGRLAVVTAHASHAVLLHLRLLLSHRARCLEWPDSLLLVWDELLLLLLHVQVVHLLCLQLITILLVEFFTLLQGLLLVLLILGYFCGGVAVRVLALVSLEPEGLNETQKELLTRLIEVLCQFGVLVHHLLHNCWHRRV